MTSDEIDIDPTESARTTYIVSGVVLLLALVAFGAVGWATGTGWFGYRQWVYGEGELYLANYSDSVRRVSVDGRQAVTLEPRRWEIVHLVGGTSRVRVSDEAGRVLETHELFTDASDAYLAVAGEACLVATDVSSFYGGDAEGSMEYLEFIRADDSLYVPGSHNVIWPGEDFPDRLSAGGGRGVWIEKVGCDHLEHRGALRAYLRIRLRDRLGRDRVPKRSGPPWKKK